MEETPEHHARFCALLDAGAERFVLEGPNSGGIGGCLVNAEGVWWFHQEGGTWLSERISHAEFLKQTKKTGGGERMRRLRARVTELESA